MSLRIHKFIEPVNPALIEQGTLTMSSQGEITNSDEDYEITENGISLNTGNFVDSRSLNFRDSLPSGDIKAQVVGNSTTDVLGIYSYDGYQIHINADDELRLSSGFQEDVVITSGTGGDISIDSGDDIRLSSSGLGFYGATPVSKPSITGGYGGSTALQNLLSELGSMGLINDNT